MEQSSGGLLAREPAHDGLLAREPARFDAVVIGTGFGGAVTACRLAQAEQRVLILERGRRYPRDSFPRNYRDLGAGWLWEHEQGLFDVRPFNEVTLVQGAGYGGGSLIYANVHLRPPADLFESGWPAGYSRELLDPYYDLVAYMLDIQPITRRAKLPAKTVLMKQIAERLERDAQFCYPNLAVNLGPEGETKDNRFGVSQTTCNNCGECDVGCNIHAKNTLDLNYLALAEQRGAAVRTQCEVTKIAPAADGSGYDVWFHDATTKTDERVRCKHAFVCGGAVNSTELLLRCRHEHQSLPDLSDRLGERFSGNGDYLAFAFKTQPPFKPSEGPTITTGIVIDQGKGEQRDWFIFQEGGYPKEIAKLIEVLSPLLKGLPAPRQLHREAIEQQLRARLAEALAKGELDREPPDGTAIFLAMGRDRANGRLDLLPGVGLHVHWDNRLNLSLYGAEEQMARDVAKAMQGEVGTNPLWSALHIPVSVHNLGGCAMGADASEGVTDAFGEVFGYPGLYVLDGSILPEATGVNPSHTIAAVAERNIEHLIRKLRGEPAWRAPERALAPAIVDPLAGIVIPANGTAPFLTPAVGLAFTETMKGFLSFAELPQGAPEPSLADYVTAERKGQRAGSAAQFTLTITFPNLDAFLADPAHGGVAVGKLTIAGLTSAEGAPVTSGAFNLFTTTEEFYERQMLYGLPFLGDDGLPYFLDGYKQVKDHGDFDVWGSTTTLYTKIRRGQSKDGPVIAVGVLHIHVPDFLHQLTTFRVLGTHHPAEQAAALTRFGQMFLGSLWDVFVRMRLQ